MRWNARLLLGALAGTALLLVAVVHEGGHPAWLWCAPSLLLVTAIALGGVVARCGPRVTGRLLRSMVLGVDSGAADDDELASAAAVLERTTLLAASVGFGAGFAAAVASLAEPTRVGPHLWRGMTSLLYGLCLCAFVVLPLRRRVESAVGVDHPSMPRSGGRPVRVLATLGVVLLGLAAWPGAAAFSVAASVPGVAFVLAVVVPALVTGGRTGASADEWRWLPDALVCAAGIGVTCRVLHTCSVLDQPQLLLGAMGFAAAGSIAPLTAAALLRVGPAGPRPVAVMGRGSDAYWWVTVPAVAAQLLLLVFLWQWLGGVDPSVTAAPR